jgi:hypothetical protein
MAEAMLRGGDGEIFLGASFTRPSPSRSSSMRASGRPQRGPAHFGNEMTRPVTSFGMSRHLNETALTS